MHVNQKSYFLTVELIWTCSINRDQSILALQGTKVFPVTTAYCSYKRKRSSKNREVENLHAEDLGLNWPLKMGKINVMIFSPHHLVFMCIVYCRCSDNQYRYYVIVWLDKRMGGREEERKGGREEKRKGRGEGGTNKKQFCEIGHSHPWRSRASTSANNMWAQGLLSLQKQETWRQHWSTAESTKVISCELVSSWPFHSLPVRLR